jgi:hypothetical protein
VIPSEVELVSPTVVNEVISSEVELVSLTVVYEVIPSEVELVSPTVVNEVIPSEVELVEVIPSEVEMVSSGYSDDLTSLREDEVARNGDIITETISRTQRNAEKNINMNTALIGEFWISDRIFNPFESTMSIISVCLTYPEQ